MGTSTNAMDIDVRKFRRSLQGLIRLPDDELHECLRLWVSCVHVHVRISFFSTNSINSWQTSTSAASMDRALELLSHRLLDAQYTDAIRDSFPDLLMLIVTKAFPTPAPPSPAAVHDDANHVAKCVALSKLVARSQHIRK